MNATKFYSDNIFTSHGGTGIARQRQAPREQQSPAENWAECHRLGHLELPYIRYLRLQVYHNG